MIRNISLADQVFEQLEKEILTGAYAYGDILTEAHLTAALGVSRTPVREALRRLEQEGLVADTGKGMEVLGITPRDIADIYAIRAHLEGMAAAYAAANASDEEIAELAAIPDLQEFYAAKGDSAQVRDLDTRFHETLYRISKSPILESTLLPLHKRVMKYRKASIEKTGRAAVSAAEHRAICDAIRARDTAGAEAAASAHIAAARRSILGTQD